MRIDNLDGELRRIMKHSDEQHARTPTQSFGEYRQKRYQQLANSMTGRRTVYLDMNFWIWLRDPAKAPNPSKTGQLLELLRKGVKVSRLLCPVSYAVLLELMKQNPMDRRLAQARIMDELSEGIGLRNPFETAEIEYLQLLVRHNPAWSIPIDSVWAPVGHIIVEAYPQSDALPSEFMERRRKVMLDVLWAMNMDYLARRMDAMPRPQSKSAEKINLERQTNPRGGKTFEGLFADELHGLLDVMSPHVENGFKRAADFFGIKATMDETERRMCVNLIREMVTRGLDRKAIPSQRIRAALHAAIRLDDKRPFKQNDIDDFGHSAVAAAYCDVFLTEGPLAELLRRPLLQKVIPRGCAIVSDIEAAIAALS